MGAQMSKRDRIVAEKILQGLPVSGAVSDAR